MKSTNVVSRPPSRADCPHAMTPHSLDRSNPHTPSQDPRAIATFNRWCYLIASVWVILSLFVSLHIWKIEATDREYHDFSQFYMGGLIARHGAWDALYPIPHPNSPNNPGEGADSDMRPEYARLAAAAGVPANALR